MKAVFLVNPGNTNFAFEIRETSEPIPKEGELKIKVSAFGINYADIMASKGLYKDAPKAPGILGYDVVGYVSDVGSNVDKSWIGKRVVALTRFGGYAEYAIANKKAAHEVGENFSNFSAAALATQYCTAYYATHILTNLMDNENVLIHAGAGGVGLALISFAKIHDCNIFTTVGSEEKIEFLKQLNIKQIINYKTHNFHSEIIKIIGPRKINVVFDSIGGHYVKKGMDLLSPGGRMICYGGAERSKRKHIFNDIKFALGFGFYSPISLMLNSQSLMGINMLRIADHRPDIIQKAMESVINLIDQNKINMPYGSAFQINNFNEAISFVERRKSIGKVVVEW